MPYRSKEDGSSATRSIGRTRQKRAEARLEEAASRTIPRSFRPAETGITSSRDLKQLLAALACDVLLGKVPPTVAHGACAAVGKFLRTVELEMRAATAAGKGRPLQEVNLIDVGK